MQSILKIILALCPVFLNSCKNGIDLPKNALKPTHESPETCYEITISSGLSPETFRNLFKCLRKTQHIHLFSDWITALSDRDLEFLLGIVKRDIIKNPEFPSLADHLLDRSALRKFDISLAKLLGFLREPQGDMAFLFLKDLLSDGNIAQLFAVIGKMIEDQSFINNLAIVSRACPERPASRPELALKIPGELFEIARSSQITRTIAPALSQATQKHNFVNYVLDFNVYKNGKISDDLTHLKDNRVLVYSYFAPNVIIYLKRIENLLLPDDRKLYNSLYGYFNRLRFSGSWKRTEKMVNKTPLQIFARRVEDLKGLLQRTISESVLNELTTTPLGFIFKSWEEEDPFNLKSALNLLFTHETRPDTLFFQNAEGLLFHANMPIIPASPLASSLAMLATGLPLQTHNVADTVLAMIAFSNGPDPDAAIMKDFHDIYRQCSLLRNDSRCRHFVKNCDEEFIQNKDWILENFLCPGGSSCEPYLDESGNNIFLYFQPLLRSLALTDSLSILKNIANTGLLTRLKNIFLYAVDSDMFLTLNGEKPCYKALLIQIEALIKTTAELLRSATGPEDSRKLVSEVFEQFFVSITNSLEKRELLGNLIKSGGAFKMLKAFIHGLSSAGGGPLRVTGRISEVLKDADSSCHIHSILRTLLVNTNFQSNIFLTDAAAIRALFVDMTKFLKFLVDSSLHSR